MGVFNNFRTGVRTYKEAHAFIKMHKLWLFVFLPAIINVALLLLLIFVGWPLFGALTGRLLDLFGLTDVSGEFMQYLAVALQWILRIVFYILLFLFYAMIYRYIVLIILSPMLALLSEKSEKLLTGKVYPFRFGHFVHDVLRGIAIALRNLVMETLMLIVLFFLSYIPVIGYICPAIIFFITCYYYGFSMIDYTCERQRMSVKQSAGFIRKNRGFAIANGMIFYLVFFFIPVIGFMVAPAYAVVAATLGVHKIKADQGEILMPEKELKTDEF